MIHTTFGDRQRYIRKKRAAHQPSSTRVVTTTVETTPRSVTWCFRTVSIMSCVSLIPTVLHVLQQNESCLFGIIAAKLAGTTLRVRVSVLNPTNRSGRQPVKKPSWCASPPLPSLPSDHGTRHLDDAAGVVADLLPGQCVEQRLHVRHKLVRPLHSVEDSRLA